MPLDLAKIYSASPLQRPLNPLQMHQLSESARKGGRERLRGQIVGFHADEGPRATSAALAKYGFGEQSRAMAATADTAEDRALADQQRVWGTVYKILSTVTVAERQARDAGKDDAGVDMAMRNAWDTAVKGLANIWTGEGESPIAAFEFEDREDIMMKALALSKQETPGRYIDLADGTRWDTEATDPDELSQAQIANNAEIIRKREAFIQWLTKDGGSMDRVKWASLTEGNNVVTRSLIGGMEHMTGDDPGFEEFWNVITENTELEGTEPPPEIGEEGGPGLLNRLGRLFGFGDGGEAAFDFDDPDVPEADKTAKLSRMLSEGTVEERGRAIDLVVAGILREYTVDDVAGELGKWGISNEEYLASVERQGLLAQDAPLRSRNPYRNRNP